MHIFSWNDIISRNFDTSFFEKGSSLSIGSFDGPHIGHKCLFNSLLNNAKKNNYLSGIITFIRPMPSVKHNSDYFGDISTLKQKTDFFEKIGIDFCVLIEFSDNFKKIDGIDFLKLLKSQFNMKFITEGKDFHFGFKGKDSIKEIEIYSNQNNIEFEFPNLLLQDEYRVSSSMIRKMISKGDLSKIGDLLWNQYVIDLRFVNYKKVNNKIIFSRENIYQVLPPVGVYDFFCNKKKTVVEITKFEVIVEESSLTFLLFSVQLN